MTAAIRATGITRSFGSGKLRAVAVRDVSLELARGRMTLLMGPSGSGKSTLLAILSGLLDPDCGTVEALGAELTALSARARERFRREHCGFVFQGYNLFGALSARQQLDIVLRWSSGRRGGHDSERALAELGLAAKTESRPSQLSGGEKQRVAVARALVKDPALLFADEPTAALDWEHGRQVVELLRRAAHERGTCVFLVSHDPRIVPLADHVVCLEDGRLREGSLAGQEATIIS